MSKIVFLKNLQTLLTPLKRLIDRKAENVNWNENDPSASGYIANRPFYSGEKFEKIINSTTISIDEDYGYAKLATLPSQLIPNETYLVTLNGITYECVARDWHGECTLIGNGEIYGDENPSNNEPFACDSYSDGSIYLNVLSAGDYTITISEKVEEIVKIPEKYLPEIGEGATIGIKGTGKNAEVFNGGYPEQASGNYAHAEGYDTHATGTNAHAEGEGTYANGSSSHTEGIGTHTIGWGQHAQGRYNIKETFNPSRPYGQYAHTVGNGQSNTSRSNAHTLDWNGNAWYSGDVYVGGSNQSTGERLAKISEIPEVPELPTIPNDNLVNGTNEGSLRTVNSKMESDDYKLGQYAFAEGYNTSAKGSSSHAEGFGTTAYGTNSHAEGSSTTAYGNFSHAEGYETLAQGSYGSHAEGNSTIATGQASHAEGGSTTASGHDSHAEGHNTVASNMYAHAEGNGTEANGVSSHAEGENTKANGTRSHAEGSNTIAHGDNQHVQGHSNIEDTENIYAHIVGNGTYTSRSNAHTLDWSGVGWFAGGLKVGGTGQNDEAAVEVALKSDIITYSDATASAAGLVSTGTQTFGGTKTFNDAITAKRIVISDTGANRHLRFSREGFNYIAAPETGTIAFSFGENANEDNTTLAIHTDTVKLYSGNTANFADGTLKIKTLNIPTASNGTTYGAGTSGQVLKSNGSTIYWGNDVDTTYSAATTTAAGLMTAAMVTKLNGIASGANAYTHPSHTSKSSGLYKITVDSQGHVSAATAVAKADITALGIPAQDTTYSAATASAAGLMSTEAQTFAGAKTFNDTITAKRITITDTASGKHLAFSREGWNYIMAPATGTIAFACADTVDSDNATASITADGMVLKGTTNVSYGTLKLKTLNIPTTSGGSTYGAGSSGQVLKSNGTTVYWSSDVGEDAVSKTSTTTQLMAASIALRDRSTTEDSWKYFGSTRYITSAAKGYTFQMGIGSAGAATLLLYESSDTNTSLNSMTLNPDSTVFKKPVTIASGGTGATTADEACKNIGAAIVGVGESIPSGADLNTYTTPGSYRSYQASISASLLNTPYTGTGFKLEVFNTTTANQIMQEIKTNAATSRTYRRTASLSNGTWTFNSWVKVMHSTSDTLAIGDGGTGASTADGACQNLGAVRKSGDTMTGGLTAARLAIIAEYPTLGFKSGTKTNENAFIQVNTNGQIGLYSYNDDQDSKTTRYYEGYYLPVPDSGRTAKKTYPILTGKSPVTIAQGGTGLTNAKDVQSFFMNSFNTTSSTDLSTMDVFTLPPGIYHHESETSTANHYPIAATRALVEVKGQYRTGTAAADGYPNGYWSIRVYYPYSGEEYWNHRTWSSWTGWRRVHNSAGIGTPLKISGASTPGIDFYDSDTNVHTCSIYFDNSSNRRLTFKQLPSDMDSASTRYAEYFRLPIPASGLTANKTYDILTTKQVVYSSTQPAYEAGKIWLKPV